MRGMMAAAYFLALGWYIRWSGLDEECVRIARDGWDIAVKHTYRVAIQARADREAEIYRELLEESQ